MKKQFILLCMILIMAGMHTVNAQTLNWASLEKNKKQIVSASLGLEHGVVFGVGYSRQVTNKFLPLVANMEVSVPSGQTLADEFKTKIGGQIRWFSAHHFQFSTRIQGVFRRYENDFVRLLNFGSDLAAVAGYYKPRWFVAAEAGFDKAIVTHFKHAEAYREQFPGVVDGWFEPASGGNFYCGIQAGYTFGKNDVFIRAGKVLTQDFKTKPLVPVYAQVGLNLGL